MGVQFYSGGKTLGQFGYGGATDLAGFAASLSPAMAPAQPAATAQKILLCFRHRVICTTQRTPALSARPRAKKITSNNASAPIAAW